MTRGLITRPAIVAAAAPEPEDTPAAAPALPISPALLNPSVPPALSAPSTPVRRPQPSPPSRVTPSSPDVNEYDSLFTPTLLFTTPYEEPVIGPLEQTEYFIVGSTPEARRAVFQDRNAPKHNPPRRVQISSNTEVRTYEPEAAIYPVEEVAPSEDAKRLILQCNEEFSEQAKITTSILPEENSGTSNNTDEQSNDGHQSRSKVEEPLENDASPSTHTAPRDSISGDESLAKKVGALTVSTRQSARREKLRKEKEAKKREEEEAARAAEEAAALARAAELADEERKAAALLRRMPSVPFVQPLSAEWAARLQREMQKPEGTILARSVTGTELTRHDFSTVLGSTSWLNDEIINAYLDATVDYANTRAGTVGRNVAPKYVTFNSFFYSNLNDKGPGSVARWMKRKKAEGKKLLGVEVVLIPICKNSHWTLLVISPMKRTIEYLDSFGSIGADKINNAKLWLAQELGNAYKPEEWKVLETKSAEQHNGYDCGVFAVTNAKAVALGLDPTCYDASDMAAQRRRVAAELMAGGFVGDLAPSVELLGT
jgi:Ulp1 family protease